MQIHQSNEYVRGQMVGAATAALTHASCIPEFERMVRNQLREKATLNAVFRFDELKYDTSDRDEYNSFWIHMARLVIFMAEGYMPNAT